MTYTHTHTFSFPLDSFFQFFLCKARKIKKSDVFISNFLFSIFLVFFLSTLFCLLFGNQNPKFKTNQRENGDERELEKNARSMKDI